MVGLLAIFWAFPVLLNRTKWKSGVWHVPRSMLRQEDWRNWIGPRHSWGTNGPAPRAQTKKRLTMPFVRCLCGCTPIIARYHGKSCPPKPGCTFLYKGMGSKLHHKGTKAGFNPCFQNTQATHTHMTHTGVSIKTGNPHRTGSISMFEALPFLKRSLA